jgi:hypothetical protein
MFVEESSLDSFARRQLAANLSNHSESTIKLARSHSNSDELEIQSSEDAFDNLTDSDAAQQVYIFAVSL